MSIDNKTPVNISNKFVIKPTSLPEVWACINPHTKNVDHFGYYWTPHLFQYGARFRCPRCNICEYDDFNIFMRHYKDCIGTHIHANRCKVMFSDGSICGKDMIGKSMPDPNQKTSMWISGIHLIYYKTCGISGHPTFLYDP